jgi:hypothetical protein
MIKNIKWLLFVSLTIAACSSNEDDTSGVVPQVPITKGSADFSKYVSLGNSITSGYADGALFIAGQANSYPKLLADQFSFAGGGSFTIPYMNDNTGGLLFGGYQIQNTRLYFNGSAPVNLPGLPTTEVTNHLTGTYNNMGVPGAKSFHLLAPGYGSQTGVFAGTANPYFVRFASSSTTSVIADAVAQNPTFFTLWIGNNDVLSYAISGGTGVNQTGNPDVTTYGSNDITDPTALAGSISSLLDQLTANGAKGAVGNIPYVSSVPFFTYVKPITVPALPAANSGALNQLFGAINQIAAGGGLPSRFVTLTTDDGNPATTEAKNPVLIYDETLVDLSSAITSALTPLYGSTNASYIGSIYGRARHARVTPGDRDFILLTAGTSIGTNQSGVPSPYNVIGVSYPMQDSSILTADEASQIKVATDAYNASIKSLASAKGLAFVDANAALNQVANGGVIFDNFQMTSDFIQGGAFGLDGVHPSARGQAYIANKFIEAINATYGSTIRTYKSQAFPLSYPVGL